MLTYWRISALIDPPPKALCPIVCKRYFLKFISYNWNNEYLEYLGPKFSALVHSSIFSPKKRQKASFAALPTVVVSYWYALRVFKQIIESYLSHPCLPVDRLVSPSVCHNVLKGGMLHFHAFIGALIYIYFRQPTFSSECPRRLLK